MEVCSPETRRKESPCLENSVNPDFFKHCMIVAVVAIVAFVSMAAIGSNLGDDEE